MAITNLNQYYQSQGQALPTVQARQAVASQAGISNYTGTAQQNAQLLAHLQKPVTPATPVAPITPTPTPAVVPLTPAQQIQAGRANMPTKATTPPAPTQEVVNNNTTTPASTIETTPQSNAVTTQQPTSTPTPTVTTPINIPTPVVPNTPTNTNQATTITTPEQRRQALFDQKRQSIYTKNNSIYTTGSAINDAVKSGSLIPGTQAFANLQQSQPNAFAEYNQIQKDEKNKKQVEDTGNIILGNGVVTQPAGNNLLNDLLTKISSGMDTDIATSYKNAVVNDPDYLTANEAVLNASNELNTVNKNINALGDDTRKLYSGETPESVIASDIARRAKPLLLQAQFLQAQLDTAKSEAARIMDNNKEMFGLQLQERQDNRNLAFKLYDTINAAEIRKEDTIRADKELQAKMESAKSEQEYNMYKDERDYNFKVAQALDNQEKDQRDYDLKVFEANKQKASDFLQRKTQNEDGSESISYRNPITGQTMGASEVFGNTPSTQGGSTPMSSVLGAFSAEGQMLLSAPVGSQIPSELTEFSPQNAKIQGKECAEYVNDILGKKLLGSTYQSKIDVCNETTGGVGSVVAWKPNGSGSYGHTGIIVDEDANNYWVKSSNYTPGTITVDKIPKEKIKNFYTPPGVKQAQEQQSTPPNATIYPNGNVRTTDGVLYSKKEVIQQNSQLQSSESYKALKASESFAREWNNYKELLNTYGIEMMPGETKAKMQGAYERVMRQAQTFFGLGVLQKLDEDAVRRMIPVGARDIIGSKYLNPFERSDIAGKIQQVDDMIKGKIQGEYDSLNTIYGNFGDSLSGLKDVKRIHDNQDILNQY